MRESDGERSLGARLLEIFVLAALYYGLARASLLFASINPSATPIWPPTGLALAALTIRGIGVAPGVFIGALAANLAITPSLATSSVIALGNASEALVAAFVLRRWAGGEDAFATPSGVGKFALTVIGLATPLSATIGVSALAAAGAATDDFFSIWTTWWLGDVAGAVLVAPALVLWLRSVTRRDSAPLALEAILCLSAAAGVGLLALSPVSPAPGPSRGALTFVAILPLLWAALRFGPRETTSVALVLSAFAIWGVQAGSSPFVHGTQNNSFLLLIAFVVSVTLPSLALAADHASAAHSLSNTRRELRQAQKLEALGHLTGGVAHDFNNLLMAISGGLQTLERGPADRARTLAMLRMTVERGVSLTRRLLAFARREAGAFSALDLNDVIAELEPLLVQSLGANIALKIEVEPDLPEVLADRSQFELAILNLALNARDAMPDGGALSIKLESNGPQFVRICVRDTGTGMSPEVAAQAFEPFFTTKPEGQGTGLGLSQVQSFAKQTGGHVAIETAAGDGSAVLITLPTMANSLGADGRNGSVRLFAQDAQGDAR